MTNQIFTSVVFPSLGILDTINDSWSRCDWKVCKLCGCEIWSPWRPLDLVRFFIVITFFYCSFLSFLFPTSVALSAPVDCPWKICLLWKIPLVVCKAKKIQGLKLKPTKTGAKNGCTLYPWRSPITDRNRCRAPFNRAAFGAFIFID